MIEIKPCPFCNYKVTLTEEHPDPEGHLEDMMCIDDWGNCSFTCSNCSCCGPCAKGNYDFYEKEVMVECIEKWNNRYEQN